jgi:hypothetical protein
MDGDKDRDKVLSRMLKTPPQPKQKPIVDKEKRGAAKGVTLDNLAAMTPGLRDAARGKAKSDEGSWRRTEPKTKKP